MSNPNLAVRGIAEVSAIEELLSTWDAKAAERQIAQDYCTFTMGVTENLTELFVDATYRRYLAARQATRRAHDAQVVRRFLVHVQARRPELALVALPRLDLVPESQKSALVERFLRSGEGDLIRAEVYQALRDVVVLTGLPAASVEPMEFCRPDVVEALGQRIARWTKHRQPGRQMAYRFVREQAEAAGLDVEAQRQLLAPLTLPNRPHAQAPLSPWIAEYQVHYSANGHCAPQDTLTAVRSFESFVTRTFPHLLDDSGCLDLRRLREEHVLAYVSRLRVGAGTRKVYFSRLRGCLSYHVASGHVGAEVLRPLRGMSKKVKPKVVHWDLHRLQRLRAALFELQDPMLQAAIGILVVSGCRPGEICALRVEDWDPVARQIRFAGKRGIGPARERWVPMESDQVIKDNGAYLQQRLLPWEPGDQHMFILPSGRPLSPETLRDRFRELKKAASIHDGGSPRILRKTFDSLLAQEGIDATIRMELMGHQDISSQQSYTVTSFDEAVEEATRVMRRKRHASQTSD